MDMLILIPNLSLFLFCGIITIGAEHEVKAYQERLRIFKRHASRADIDKARVCKAFGCLNGHCLESELQKYRIVCICYPGYEGKLCDRPSCPIPCEKHGKCIDNNGKLHCKCKSGYTGASCSLAIKTAKSTQPKIKTQSKSKKHKIPKLQLHIVKDGKRSSIIIDTLDSLLRPAGQTGNSGLSSSSSNNWITNVSPSHDPHPHAVVDRNVEPQICAPGFQCYHGRCDQAYLAQGRFRCLCEKRFTGLFCDKRCTLKCKNNGLCYADPHGHQYCMCPWEYTGLLCQEIAPRNNQTR